MRVREIEETSVRKWMTLWDMPLRGKGGGWGRAAVIVSPQQVQSSRAPTEYEDTLHLPAGLGQY